MLTTKVTRVDPWYITALLPMPIVDGFKIMTPALAIGGLSAILMRDSGVFLLSIALGYICVIWIGRMFVQYKLSLKDEDEFQYVVGLLEKTDILERQGDKLLWIRRDWPKLLNSKSDEIKISAKNAHWVIQGRKYDILSVAAALNDREKSRKQV